MANRDGVLTVPGPLEPFRLIVSLTTLTLCEARTVVCILTLQTRKRRHSEVEELARSHTANQWQSQKSPPGWCLVQAHPLSYSASYRINTEAYSESQSS